MEVASTSTGFATTRCHYQDADTTQTLREGLAEYRAANPALFDPDQMSQQAELGQLGRFFACHDACHVLFGLSTSLPDEALADTWTLFGTDVQWRELWTYFRSDAQKQFFKDFLGEVGYWTLIVGSIRALPRAMRAVWRSRKMTRKWALHDWAEHLDTPLNELRAHYNISLV